MKTVFIWREESKSYITKLSIGFGDKTIVCSEESLNKLKLSGFQVIFILVELNWSDNIFDGYSVASSIVKDWKDDNAPPNIQFFSCIDQLKLYEYTKNTDKFFVKSFTHYLLPFDNSFNSEPYSKSKWKYLKKYALTKSGILETINHDLKRDLSNSETNFDKKFTYYKEKLLSINTLLNNDIIELLNSSNLSSKQILKDLSELIGLRMQELNLIESNKSLVYKGVKERILLVEDDEEFANKIKEALEVYFEVDYYSNGKEAIEALEVGGITYQALITDLELLQNNKKIDQPIQGIEIIEKVSESYPYIVKRIVSGLPRKGISELVNIDINDVLYKSVIAFYGFSEGFETWVKKLKKDIKTFSSLRYMKGPDNTFWNDPKEFIDKKGNLKITGSGFKRFYYLLQKEDETTFLKISNRVENRVINILKDETSEVVETKFIKNTNAQDYLSKKNKENSLVLLEQILTHRLLWISYFNNGEEVVYRDNTNLAISWAHKEFWKSNYNKALKRNNTLSIKPTGDFSFLGFKTTALQPTNKDSVDKDTSRVVIKFETKELFLAEEKFKVKHKNILKSTINDFSFKYYELCLNMYWWATYANNTLEDKILCPINCLDFTEDSIKKTLSELKTRARSISKSDRYNIRIELEEFMDSQKFNKIPSYFQEQLNEIIDNHILS